MGGELQTQFFHNGNGFYSNGGTVKLCVARTDNAAVVIDGVELTKPVGWLKCGTECVAL